MTNIFQNNVLNLIFENKVFKTYFDIIQIFFPMLFIRYINYKKSKKKMKANRYAKTCFLFDFFVLE